MKPLHYLGLALGVSSMLAITGCGSSGSSIEDSGTLELAVTDAEEDFLSYKIELDSVTLNRRDGSKVDILPLSTEIDFVQYQELSELFAVMSVPSGIYESITLSLDYSNANIVIQDEAGVSYTASVVDSEGAAVTEFQVELKLDNDKPLVITPQKTSQLTLDLDLAASNTIESFDPPLVSVEPFMLAFAELDMEREHRVRGLMASVNAAEQLVTLDVKPMRLKQGEFGQFTFAVNSETKYEINGVEYNAETGISALASLSASPPLVAFGVNIKDDDLPYLASQVIAGTSVPWNNQDVLKGTITARADNNLTIEGAVVEAAGQAGHFRQSITMSIGENSIVTGYRLGDADITNLSVGQEILALGSYDQSISAFNSNDGAVRMKLNRIVGEVVQQSPLAIDLSHINKRPVSVFDFAGTGISELDDADPSNYQINTSNLDLSGIETSEWLQVRGYPTNFGSAPNDFDALSIINPQFSSHAARFMVKWDDDAEATLNTQNQVLNIITTQARSKLHLVGVPGSSQLDMNVATISAEGETGIYAILGRGEGIHVYLDFGNFISALNSYIEQGFMPKHLTAGGNYSDDTDNLSSMKVTIFLSASTQESEEESIEELIEESIDE
ncbi:MAG: hypothetical protein ACJAS1_004189 [Oleiphilaceae bacterium]|jgi:hypothetical protein